MQANKERKFTQAMEKWIMYFMYALFGGLFLLISIQGDWRESLVLFPVAVISLSLTKWGMKWQNERYLRSAENQDEIEYLKKKVDNLEKRISNLEEE
ncbi:hypothetical protein N9851_01925 [Acidimicrobiia bacterium]|jgi:hypothetical protein|nr:hypothetical protein [Acidimicrobiia bacterium]MDB4249836.1 hypothetical protein [Acidimicrobiia bacterium]MDC1070794.1 hypothetical protein [Acidimicrobiia bacterium]|tara:strand:+ start:295 stop:585 length:291 start_codon:yes stop_codon:yes gene_type:complete